MNSVLTQGMRGIGVVVVAAVAAGAQAADRFDPASNLLTLDSVTVNGVTYGNVAVTLNAYSLLGVAGGSPVADTFDPASSTLTLGAVAYQGSTYNNVLAKIDSYTLLGVGGSTSAPSDVVRGSAASATAQRSSGPCAAIQPFYWEVGNKSTALVSGSVNKAGNANGYTAETQMSIASASKWIYGAYVAERRAGALTAQDIQFLNFRSGYTQFTSCDPSDTVASCVARGSNGVQSALTIDKFDYGGGHMQKHASLMDQGMNLGALDNAGLAQEVRRVLGNDIGMTYLQPQLAGGVRSSAKDYAVFLRKLLNGQLKMAALLGSNAVCTNPLTCPSAVGTPVPSDKSWSYSIGHWLENDPVTGDGAFSSAGAFGFYPWIDASKSYYGIVARFDALGSGSGNESAVCGALIRKAWVSGVAQ